MADWQIPIIILAGASLVAGFILLKKHKDRDQKVEVLYGYITSVFIGYIGTDSIGSLIKRFAAKKAGVEDGGNQ